MLNISAIKEARKGVKDTQLIKLDRQFISSPMNLHLFVKYADVEDQYNAEKPVHGVV